MADDKETRDRVRALVREVLKNAVPADEAPDAGAGRVDAASATPKGQGGDAPARARVVEMVPETAPPSASEPPFARDESSKSVITEADVHGLEEGARLRVAEGARLTPLAADIVRERR